MRVTFELDAKTYRELQGAAQASDLSVETFATDAIRKAVRDYLEKHPTLKRRRMLSFLGGGDD